LSAPGRQVELLVPACGRLLGIDLGSRRVGVAACDSGRRMASGVTVIPRVGDRVREHRQLAGVVEEYDAVGLIVGLPLSLSGQVGPAASGVLAEVDELRNDLGIPVETHDERFTTVSAASALAASGRRGPKQRALVDQVAAAMILQSWIDGPGGRR